MLSYCFFSTILLSQREDFLTRAINNPNISSFVTPYLFVSLCISRLSINHLIFNPSPPPPPPPQLNYRPGISSSWRQAFMHFHFHEKRNGKYRERGELKTSDGRSELIRSDLVCKCVTRGRYIFLFWSCTRRPYTTYKQLHAKRCVYPTSDVVVANIIVIFQRYWNSGKLNN